MLVVASCALVHAPLAAQSAQRLAPGLNWVRGPGAEGCFSAADLSARVENQLGRSVFVVAASADLFVDGYVERSLDGYRVTLEISDLKGRVLGHRELAIAGAACRAIEEPVSFVIALTLNPGEQLPGGGIPLDADTAGGLEALFGNEPTDPDPATLPPLEPPAVSDPPKPVGAQPRAPHAPRPPLLAFDLGGAAGLGQVPGLTGALSLHVALAPPPFVAFELGLSRWFASEVALDDDAGAGRFELLTAGLAVCPWSWVTHDVTRLCGGFELGRLVAEPRDFAGASERFDHLVANLTASGEYDLALVGNVFIRLGLSLGLPLIQRTYSYQAADGSTQQMFRTAQLTGRLELGLGAMF